MYSYNSLQSVEALQDWFNQLPDPKYFSVYRGNDKKPGDRIISYTFDNVEQGWQLLLQTVINQTSSGGILTIYVDRSEKGTSGFTTRFSSPMTLGVPAMNGVGNSPAISMDQIERMVEAKSAKMLEEYKLQRRIEDLEQENEDLRKGRGKTKGLQATINGIGTVLEDNPTLAGIVAPVINAVITKLLGIGEINPAMAMNGIPRKIVAQGFKSDEDTESEDEISEEEYSQEDFDRIMVALDDLSKVFDDPIDILEKVSTYAVSNPTMAKTILQNLK